MAFNFNYGFTPEQIKKLMTPPTPPPTGIETMADKVGMGDFTAEVPVPVPETVPVPKTVDYSGFNPDGGSFTGVTPPGPGSVDPTQPSSADAVPGIPDYGGYVNSFPDLEEAYRNRSNRDQSIEEWGEAHYDRHGRAESRTLPTRPPLGRETGGFYNPFNPYGGSFTGVTQDDTAPVDPIANLTPMPPRDANVRAPTNYRLTAAPPVSASTQGDPFERPEEGILSLRASNPRGPFRRPATPEGGR